MTINCPRCQAACPDKAKFCSSCGHDLKQQPPRPYASSARLNTRKPPVLRTWTSGITFISSTDHPPVLVSDQQAGDQKLIRQTLIGLSIALLLIGLLVGAYIVVGPINGQLSKQFTLPLLVAALFSFLVGLGALIGLLATSSKTTEVSDPNQGYLRPIRAAAIGGGIAVASGLAAVMVAIFIYAALIVVLIVCAIIFIWVVCAGGGGFS
jgi:hypothetical protein